MVRPVDPSDDEKKDLCPELGNYDMDYVCMIMYVHIYIYVYICIYIYRCTYIVMMMMTLVVVMVVVMNSDLLKPSRRSFIR